MGFTVRERHTGRKPSDGDNPSNEIPFLIISDSAEEEEDALIALRAEAPATLGDLKLVQCKIDEALPGAAAGWFLGTAVYGSPEQKDTNESTFTFDTTGGQFNVKQALDQVWYPIEAPDVGGGINVTADSVDGVEITIPQYAFSETHYIPDADVNDTYKGVLFALTGTVNNATFRGCSAGECLFLGARGQKRGRGDWEITFSFAASPNVSGLTIGDITGIDKPGWEYLWCKYVRQAVGEDDQRTMAMIPKAVYVAKVYNYTSFASLGLGS